MSAKKILYVCLFFGACFSLGNADEQTPNYHLKPKFTIGQVKHIHEHSEVTFSFSEQPTWQMISDVETTFHCTNIHQNNSASFEIKILSTHFDARCRNKKLKTALHNFFIYLQDKVNFSHTFTISVDENGVITNLRNFKNYVKKFSNSLDPKKMPKSSYKALKKRVLEIFKASSVKVKKDEVDSAAKTMLKSIKSQFSKLTKKNVLIENEQKKGNTGWIAPLFYYYPKKSLKQGTKFSTNSHKWQVTKLTDSEIHLKTKKTLYQKVPGQYVQNPYYQPYPSSYQTTSSPLYNHYFNNNRNNSLIYIPGYSKKIGREERVCHVDAKNGFVKKEIINTTAKESGNKVSAHNVRTVKTTTLAEK